MKILIIKLGYSETLDPEINRVPSLGDVLRTTPLLWALKEKFPDSHITWLVAEEAFPLLHGNLLINRILTWDEFMPFQLMREKFDILINLEKIAGICALSDMIDAWTKYGFRFDSIEGCYQAYEKGLSFVDYIGAKTKNDKPRDYWQKVLIEMLGVKWRGQSYILGYKPRTKEVNDIGLNYKVGSKWPTKTMSEEKWKSLEGKLLDAGYTVSWQQGLKDLHEYIDWLNSNRLIITQDSLGLHLALALNKKIVALFGATDAKEILMHEGNTVIYAHDKCSYMPCYSAKCANSFHCMEKINLDEVVRAAALSMGK